MSFHVFPIQFYARNCPTVCVTRAGAGGGTLSDWENAEAWKKAWNRAESAVSGARFVWRATIIAALCSEKILFVAPHLQEYPIQMNAHDVNEIEKPEFEHLVTRLDIL
jgi:hypothetical protein